MSNKVLIQKSTSKNASVSLTSCGVKEVCAGGIGVSLEQRGYHAHALSHLREVGGDGVHRCSHGRVVNLLVHG